MLGVSTTNSDPRMVDLRKLVAPCTSNGRAECPWPQVDPATLEKGLDSIRGFAGRDIPFLAQRLFLAEDKKQRHPGIDEPQPFQSIWQARTRLKGRKGKVQEVNAEHPSCIFRSSLIQSSAGLRTVLNAKLTSWRESLRSGYGVCVPAATLIHTSRLQVRAASPDHFPLFLEYRKGPSTAAKLCSGGPQETYALIGVAACNQCHSSSGAILLFIQQLLSPAEPLDRLIGFSCCSFCMPRSV